MRGAAGTLYDMIEGILFARGWPRRTVLAALAVGILVAGGVTDRTLLALGAIAVVAVLAELSEWFFGSRRQ